MAWQDVARANLQGEAPGVIDVLNGVDANYDWAPAILQAAAEGQGQDGWFDPSRDAPASVAWGILGKAAALDPVNSDAINSARSGNVNGLRLRQVDAIQREQGSHGGGGLSLGTVLTIGGIALGGAGLIGLATEAAGAAAIGGEALGAEFGVQGDLAGVLTAGSESAGAIELGSEFGVQGDFAGTLANGATAATGASSIASNALSASQLLKGASDAASVANGVLKLAGTAATVKGIRNATGSANPIDFSKLGQSSTPAPIVFNAAAPAAEAGSSSIGSLSWQTIGLVLILIVAVIYGG